MKEKNIYNQYQSTSVKGLSNNPDYIICFD